MFRLLQPFQVKESVFLQANLIHSRQETTELRVPSRAKLCTN